MLSRNMTQVRPVQFFTAQSIAGTWHALQSNWQIIYAKLFIARPILIEMLANHSHFLFLFGYFFLFMLFYRVDCSTRESFGGMIHWPQSKSSRTLYNLSHIKYAVEKGWCNRRLCCTHTLCSIYDWNYVELIPIWGSCKCVFKLNDDVWALLFSLEQQSVQNSINYAKIVVKKWKFRNKFFDAIINVSSVHWNDN